MSAVTRAERWALTGGSGATLWLTGRPAAGKTTLGQALERALVDCGRPALLLDGDALRRGLSADLGFTRADRAEQVRRTGHVALQLAEAGVVAVVALVSPHQTARDAVRAVHAAADVPFVEVYVDTPPAVCEQRDPKGLYARARRGALTRMTGVDDPYEPPAAPEVVVSGTAPTHAGVGAILGALSGSGPGPR